MRHAWDTAPQNSLQILAEFGDLSVSQLYHLGNMISLELDKVAMVQLTDELIPYMDDLKDAFLTIKGRLERREQDISLLRCPENI